MNPEVYIFTHPQAMAETLAEEFYRYVLNQFITRNNLFVALSGGTTPLMFFEVLSDFNSQKKNKIDWKKLHFFWGDERCVSHDDPESNYGNANKVLFSKIDIPQKNVYPINGDSDPVLECENYAKLIKKTVPSSSGTPIFDWIFLGIGEDGHTASLFPDQMDLLTSDKICEIAIHPETKQQRITLTGKTINMAKRITFMVTGVEKQDVVKQILNKEAPAKKYPASKITPEKGRIDWYLDSQAAELI
jgi:6-phosphogluconolactonase